MAKPKFPKKSNGKEPVSTTTAAPLSPSPQMSDASAAPVEASAASATETETSKKNGAKKTARKPAIVKTEPRANLLPINLDDEIRRLAYLLSERRGFESGHEAEDWLTAEREIRQRYRQPSQHSA